eukprot:3066548-Amphidinium_carterae.2
MLGMAEQQSNPTAEARALRLTQVQQYRRRRSTTPRTTDNQQYYIVDLGATNFHNYNSLVFFRFNHCDNHHLLVPQQHWLDNQSLSCYIIRHLGDNGGVPSTIPSTAKDNEHLTMVNGLIGLPGGTGVRHRHNDGTTTTAETITSSSTMPQPVPMEADNGLLSQPPQPAAALDNVPDETMDSGTSDTSSIAEDISNAIDSMALNN